jgi:hypothetical protein
MIESNSEDKNPMNNLRVWELFGATNPKYTKPFKRAGGFSGTAIHPVWAIKRATEIFGPIGIGWGYNVLQATPVHAVGNNETLVFVLVKMWYICDGNTAEVEQWGGDKISIINKEGVWRTNDEAYKMATTDGLLKCFSYIGLGSDIHLGMYEDSKYVRSAELEWKDENKPTISVEEKNISDKTNSNWKKIYTYLKLEYGAEKLPSEAKRLLDEFTKQSYNTSTPFIQVQEDFMKKKGLME